MKIAPEAISAFLKNRTPTQIIANTALSQISGCGSGVMAMLQLSRTPQASPVKLSK